MYSYTPKVDTGIFIAEILAKDSKGLSDTLSVEFTIISSNIVDRVAPVIDFTNISSDKNVILSNSVKLDITVTDASGIATLTCSTDTVNFVVTPTGVSTYTCDITGLVQGIETKVTIVAIDSAAAANTTTAEIYFTYNPTGISSQGPSIELKNPFIDSATVASSSMTVELYVTDPDSVASVTCTFGDTTLNVKNITDSLYAVEVSVLVPGKNTLTFIATDASSSANTTKKDLTITFNESTDIGGMDGPLIELISPATSGTTVATSTIPVEVEITDASGVVSVTCSFGDKALTVTPGAANTYSVVVPELAPGENILTFAAIDASANANKAEKSIIILYDPTITDTIPPTITLQSPSDSSIVSVPSVTVEFTCTDTNGIKSVTCSFADTVVSVTQGAAGIYSATITGLVIGENSMIFSAIDKSTNANKATRTVTVIYKPDLVKPTPPKMVLKNPIKNGVRLLEDTITIQLEVTSLNGVASVTCTRAGVAVPVTNVGSLFSAVITDLAPGKTEAITFEATEKSSNANRSKINIEVQYNTLVSAVTLETPADKATGVSFEPTFTWAGGNDPDGDSVFFKVVYGTSIDALSKETSEKSERTTTIGTENKLNPFTTYYWQVIAYSKANNDSSKSEVWTIISKCCTNWW